MLHVEVSGRAGDARSFIRREVYVIESAALLPPQVFVGDYFVGPYGAED